MPESDPEIASLDSLYPRENLSFASGDIGNPSFNVFEGKVLI